MSKITLENVNTLSYTDFVGALNQWNSLPGAYTTLNKWITFAHINKNSYYLDVACTTGLKSRTISDITGCRSVGIDISRESVYSAIFNKNTYAHNCDIVYKCIDATQFVSTEKFTHISFGASLRFFQDPKKMIEHAVKNLLLSGGYILANEFYVHKDIPKELQEEFYKAFNIYPTNISYKEVMKIYEGLEIYYEDHSDITMETDEELAYYCHSTVGRYFVDSGLQKNQELYDAIYNRLLHIKTLSNKLRPYQKYNTLVLRYNPKIYPKRFVELF